MDGAGRHAEHLSGKPRFCFTCQALWLTCLKSAPGQEELPPKVCVEFDYRKPDSWSSTDSFQFSVVRPQQLEADSTEMYNLWNSGPNRIRQMMVGVSSSKTKNASMYRRIGT